MIRKIEELSMNAVPSLKSIFYNGWILRWSNGLSKRANSVYPIYDGVQDLEKAIDYCEKFYSNVDQPTVFKISELPLALEVDRALDNRGYKKRATTNIMILPLSTMPVDFFLKDLNTKYTLKLETSIQEYWLKGYMDLNHVAIDKEEIFRHMLPTTACSPIALSVYDHETLVGIGYGAGDEEMLGIYGIAVKESYRGHGLGKLLMHTLHQEGIKKGYQTAYLMVVDDNKIAKNLYNSLGYQHLYQYWYRLNK